MRMSGAEGHARNVLDAFPFDKHGEVLLDDEARRFAARGNADADHAVVLLDLDLSAAFNAASTRPISSAAHLATHGRLAWDMFAPAHTPHTHVHTPHARSSLERACHPCLGAVVPQGNHSVR